MTSKQRIALNADWWPAACRAQGWSPNDRAFRLRACSFAVSLINPTQFELVTAIRSNAVPARPISSTNDLNAREDVDRVKACLRMLADRVTGADEVGRPQLGSARRQRDVIRDHLKCLGLYVAQPRRYLAQLVADLFNHGQPGVTMQDLTDDPNLRPDGSEGPSDLHRLVMRLAAVVNQKRNENLLLPAWAELQRPEPLTGHEMKLLAGARCACAICKRDKKPAPLVPRLENWSDFEPELELAVDEFGGPSADDNNPF